MKKAVFIIVVLFSIISCDLFSPEDLNILQNNEYDPGSSVYIGTNPLTPSKTLSEGKPTFTWSTSPLTNPVYHLQVSENADCSAPLIDEAGLTVTSYEVPEYLPNDTTLYWRVSVIDGNGDEIWSSVNELTVDYVLPVIFIANGRMHTAGIKGDNSLWMAGKNTLGYLGDGTTEIRDYPVKVMDDVKFAYVESATSALNPEDDTQVFVIKNDNTLWAWGVNTDGQLGDGTKITRTIPTWIMDGVVDVDTSGFHTLAIKTDGTLWSWGRNFNKQLGNDSVSEELSPIQVPGMVDIIDISAEGNGSLAIAGDGTLYFWGNVSYNSANTPTPLVTDTLFKVVVSNNSASFMIDVDDNLWGIGTEIGDGTSFTRTTPVQVLDNVKQVAAMHGHTLAFQLNGTLNKWGENILSPSPFMTDVIFVSAGVTFDFAVKSDNSVWVWGYEPSYGATGDANIQAQSNPQEVVW